MDDAPLVGRLDRRGDADGQPQSLLDRHRASRDPVFEGRPRDQLENQSEGSLELFDAVDGRDPGVVERRQGVRLAFEPRETFRISGELRRAGS